AAARSGLADSAPSEAAHSSSSGTAAPDASTSNEISTRSVSTGAAEASACQVASPDEMSSGSKPSGAPSRPRTSIRTGDGPGPWIATSRPLRPNVATSVRPPGLYADATLRSNSAQPPASDTDAGAIFATATGSSTLLSTPHDAIVAIPIIANDRVRDTR